MKRIAVLLLAFTCTGCTALIIADAVNSSGKKQAHEHFMASFMQTNSQRQVAGLPPLDWCTEAGKYDADWAWTFPECAKRRDAMEAHADSAKAGLILADAVTASDSVAVKPTRSPIGSSPGLFR